MFKKIRNFTIIAHIDHGKSTLADRILQICKANIAYSAAKNQTLDDMDLEREKGITIKASSVRLNYKDFSFNLIDTPGHDAFGFEVIRSLKACEISLLLIDARSGVSARTIATHRYATLANHFIIPVINKIDIASQEEIDSCLIELEEMGLDCTKAFFVSAKTGLGVEELLNYLISDACPGPKNKDDLPLRAIVIDSIYDKHIGIKSLVRVVDGTIHKDDRLKTHYGSKSFGVLGLEVRTPVSQPIGALESGEIGFVITQVKSTEDIRVGDTLTHQENTGIQAIEKFSSPKSMIYCTFYSEDPTKSDLTNEILKKYKLNDSAFSFTLENSKVYGICFICGFLGLLHLDIVKERIRREFNCNLVTAMPSVCYKIHIKGEPIREVSSAYDWPDTNLIDKIEEPMVLCTMVTPEEYMGKIYSIITEKRASQLQTENSGDKKVIIKCKMPLYEVITGLHDQISASTSGFADFDYELGEYEATQVSRMGLLVNGEDVPELAIIVHQNNILQIARKYVEKLSENIAREQFDIKLQATFNGKIIASETVKQYRRDVTSGCYGRDISRKKKLLEAQKEGKARLQERVGRNIASKLDMGKLVKEMNIN